MTGDEASTACTVPCCSVFVCGPAGCSRVPLRVHWSMLVFPALTLASVFFVKNDDKWFEHFTLLLFYSTVGLFGTVIMHEIGHVSCGLFFGCTPKHIMLWPLGGLAVIANFPDEYMQRVAIAFAGPAMHIPMFFGWLGMFAWTGCSVASEAAIGREMDRQPNHVCMIDPVRLKYEMTDDVPTWFAWLFYHMMYLNVSMFVFNCLVPIVPLDASTILVSSLLACDRPKMTVALIALVLSATCLAALLGQWLVFLILSSGRNQSPLSFFMICWLSYHVWGLYKAYKGGLVRARCSAPDDYR